MTDGSDMDAHEGRAAASFALITGRLIGDCPRETRFRRELADGSAMRYVEPQGRNPGIVGTFAPIGAGTRPASSDHN
jgi:hypothetical protein